LRHASLRRATLGKLVEVDFTSTCGDATRSTQGARLELVSSPINNPPCNRECPIVHRKPSKTTPASCSTRCSETRCKSLWSVMAASFRNGCSIFRRSAISICTPRSCRNIVAPHPFSGRCARRNDHRSHHHADDAGSTPVTFFCSRKFPIAPNDTAETLAPKWQRFGAGPHVSTLRSLPNPEQVHPCKQDNAQATLAPILKKEDGRINFSHTATEILNRLRGFQPWPGAYSQFRGKNLQIWQAAAFDRSLRLSELKVEGNRLFADAAWAPQSKSSNFQLGRQKADFPPLTYSRLSPRCPAKSSAFKTTRFFWQSLRHT